MELAFFAIKKMRALHLTSFLLCVLLQTSAMSQSCVQSIGMLDRLKI